MIKKIGCVQGLAGLLMGFISVTTSSCSTPQTKPLHTSSRVPAGKGDITLRTDANQNTALEISVNHLAPPERVSENAKTYVVWIEPFGEGHRPQNLGALSIDSDLRGRLKAITPFQSFDLFVTPEPSAAAAKPSGERMLWAKVNQGTVG